MSRNKAILQMVAEGKTEADILEKLYTGDAMIGLKPITGTSEKMKRTWCKIHYNKALSGSVVETPEENK